MQDPQFMHLLITKISRTSDLDLESLVCGQEAAFSTSSLADSEAAVALPELGNAGPRGCCRLHWPVDSKVGPQVSQVPAPARHAQDYHSLSLTEASGIAVRLSTQAGSGPRVSTNL